MCNNQCSWNGLCASNQNGVCTAPYLQGECARTVAESHDEYNDKEHASKNISIFLEAFFTGMLLSDCTLAVTKDYKFQIIDNKTRCSMTLTAEEMNNKLEEFRTKVLN